MEQLITKFSKTGNCEVDTDKVAKAWNDKFSISQYHEQYRLIEQVKLFKEEAFKISISKEQALEIINKVKLLPIQSNLFRSGKTWRTRSNIISEKDRIQKIIASKERKKKKQEEVEILKELISEFNNALNFNN